MAEEYKHVDSLAKAAYHGDHYDPLHLLDDLLIVTDEAVYPTASEVNPFGLAARSRT